jgi:hypothetical protein
MRFKGCGKINPVARKKQIRGHFQFNAFISVSKGGVVLLFWTMD